MTDKEAMKLALEALEDRTSLMKWQMAREALKEALAQPEPVQTTGETNVELDFYSDVTSNGQQRQLVGKVEMGQFVGDGSHKSDGNPNAEGAVAVIRGVDEYGPLLDWYRHWVNFPVGTAFYTAPPAAPVQEPEPACWQGEDGCPNRQACCDAQHCLYTIPPQRIEQNFCSRCGKRTPDAITIHTCTPPQENT